MQHRHHGIEDPDQAWILGELIAYLDHEKSGASGFQDMGDKWVEVRNAAANGTLRAADPEARDVAARWDQFGRVPLPRAGPGSRARGEASAAPQADPAEAPRRRPVKRLAETGTLEASAAGARRGGPARLSRRICAAAT